MGEEAEDVLSSTNISVDDRKKYSTVMGKFDEYFRVRKNVIFERARFNRRHQLPSETAEEYITALYHLVESCEYGGLKEELLRDRLVVGIRDLKLSERLQMESDLTLDRAKKLIRQREAVQQHNTQLQEGVSTKSPIDVSSINKQHVNPKKLSTRSQSAKPSSGGKLCTRCGRASHSSGTQCPAIGATCKRCKHKGHFASQCFSKAMLLPANEVLVKTEEGESSVEEEELTLDDAFLDAVTSESHPTSWTAPILLNKMKAVFKLDTGAEATAITEQTYKSLPKQALKQPTKLLRGPARQRLNVLGQFTATLAHQQNSAVQTVYVVQGLKTNLLGLPAITALNLLCRLGTVTCGTASIHKAFPTLFKGLGTLGDDYTIKLKENAYPYRLYTLRNVAIPLREKVKQELDHMERHGVISRVTDPTPWCAGMVVVLKSNGSVSICFDFKILNESILREAHPIPKVDDTLAHLAGATVFSKLDANSGFWQIPLARTSRPLTTFITPYGCYLFNKLPFGISCAPELFQL